MINCILNEFRPRRIQRTAAVVDARGLHPDRCNHTKLSETLLLGQLVLDRVGVLVRLQGHFLREVVGVRII